MAISRWLSMDILNDEALTLILIKLPSTHLHQYKCVSKRWYALISHQYFIRRYIESHKNLSQHFMIHSNPLSQFIVSDHHQLIQHHKSIQNIGDFSLKFLPIPRKSITNEEIRNEKIFKIVGASHGLLLCKTISKLFVCNPLTRQYLKLPPVEGGEFPKFIVGFTCNQLDPTTCEVEFMVLVLQYKFHRWVKEFKTHVFHSKTWKWETYDVVCPPPVSVLDRLSFDSSHTVLFYNGSFHWCTIFPFLAIIAYDPINRPNAFRLIKIPKTLLPPQMFWHVDYMGLIEGRIRIIAKRKSQQDKPNYFNVYDLIDYDEGIFDWKYRVEQPRNFNVTFRFLSQMNGDIVYFVNWDTKKLMLFDMDDGRSEQCTLDLSSMCNKEGVYGRAMPFTMTPWPTPIPKPPLPQMNEDVKDHMLKLEDL